MATDDDVCFSAPHAGVKLRFDRHTDSHQVRNSPKRGSFKINIGLTESHQVLIAEQLGNSKPLVLIWNNISLYT